MGGGDETGTSLLFLVIFHVISWFSCRSPCSPCFSCVSSVFLVVSHVVLIILHAFFRAFSVPCVLTPKQPCFRPYAPSGALRHAYATLRANPWLFARRNASEKKPWGRRQKGEGVCCVLSRNSRLQIRFEPASPVRIRLGPRMRKGHRGGIVIGSLKMSPLILRSSTVIYSERNTWRRGKSRRNSVCVLYRPDVCHADAFSSRERGWVLCRIHRA